MLPTQRVSRELPMRKHYLHIHFPAHHSLAPIRLHCQRDQMCGAAGEFARIQASEGEHCANDSILIAVWDIRATGNHIVKKQARVRAVLTRIRQPALRNRGLHPYRLHDGYKRVRQGIISGKLDRGRDNMCKVIHRQRRRCPVQHRLALMLFNRGRNLASRQRGSGSENKRDGPGWLTFDAESTSSSDDTTTQILQFENIDFGAAIS